MATYVLGFWRPLAVRRLREIWHMEMDKKLSRRLLLLSPLVLLSNHADARGGRGGGRGGRGGGGSGGIVGIVIVGIGATVFAVVASVNGILDWRHRRSRALAGFPIPPRCEWEKQGRCPICGEIMHQVERPAIKSSRRRSRPEKPTTTLYRCSSQLRCMGVRVVPFRDDAPN